MDPDTQNITTSPAPKPSTVPVILSFFLCISLAGIGLLAYQNMRLQRQITSLQAKPTPTLSPTPQAKPDPAQRDTANWKTYSHPTLGYSFSYPPDASVETYANSITVRIDPPDLRTIVGICPRWISFSAPTSSSSAKKTQDEYGCIHDALELEEKVFVESQYRKESQQIIDQILSTFKFVDQKSSVDTSNWKTYSNSQYNLEFKYPAMWQTSSNSSIFQGGDIVSIGIQNCCGVTISKPIKTSSSIEDYINLNINLASQQSGGIQRQNTVKVVNNEDAIESKPVICGGRCFVYTYLKHNGSMYGILSSTSDETPYSNYSEVFNQILSTFKFTN